MNEINEDLEKWVQAIHTLSQIPTQYPSFTKEQIKALIDDAFDKGNLSSMSETPKKELRSKFSYLYLGKT